MNGWDTPSVDLIALLPRTSRGPRREATFALWLTVRAALDLLLDPPLPERAQEKRLAGLETRLSSLTLPGPLRRALSTALLHLRGAQAETVAIVLAHLVAPTRETVGSEAAEAVAQAAKQARQRAR